MKQAFFLAGFFLFTPILICAQNLAVGIQGSIIHASIIGDGMSGKYQTGFQAGFFSFVKIYRKWSAGPELQFSSTKVLTGELTRYYVTSARPSADNKYLHLNYLKMPVLISYQLNNLLSFQAGPEWRYLVHTDESLRRDNEPSFKKWDWGVIGGVSINASNRIRFTGRYSLGLGNINNNINNTRKWASRDFQLGIGYKLFKKN